jgi:molecular chaperone DnaJ
MSKRDYYEVLGVSREAAGDEIKREYRRLAFQYHPDRNDGDAEAEAKFKEAAEAYEVLRDPEKRRQYDTFGHEGVGRTGFQGFSSSEDIFSAFGDIFGEFFGFGPDARRPRPQAGMDLRYNMRIPFRDAAKGTEVELKIPKKENCDRCEGSGIEPGHTPTTCQQCSGRGQIYQSQGFFRVAMTCPVCRGQGRIVTNPCSKCRGRGLTEITKTIKVRVPAGVDDGSRLRLRGEGEPGVNGGPHGDLYVVIYVEEDKIFRRRGQDLLVAAEIDVVQAILGDRIEVPTLDDPVPMDIPRGTQSGQIFQLSGLGMPHPGTQAKGDLLVEVKVKIPAKVSKKQEALLREFVKLEQEKPMKKVKGFFKKAMGD